MLGSLLFTLRRVLPDFPGRQRLLALADRWWGPFTVTTAEGVRLQAYTSSFMDAMLVRGGTEFGDRDLMLAEIERLQPGEIYIDVGANIGLYAILAARRVGTGGLVFAVEPSPRELARLLANLALNGAHHVTPFSFALSGTPGLLGLHIAPTHTGLNTLRPAESTGPALAQARVQQVAVLRFDDTLAPLLAGRRVALLKIDVEGAEMDVLLGMEKALAVGLFQRIVVEVTPKFLEVFGHTKEALYALMARHGYQPAQPGARDEWQYDEVFTCASAETDAAASAARPAARAGRADARA